MAFHFLSQEGRCVAGVDFAARTILRFGVALLGARITAGQVMQLGVGPVLTVIAGVVLTIAVGRLSARLFGLDKELGFLTGGAVAICGASAAMALSAVMPRSEHAECNLILTVVGVTTLSTILVAFVSLVLVNSLGLIPAAAATAASDLSRWCLVTAIAALGIKTSLEKLAVVGWKPVALMAGETAFLAVLVLAAVLLLGVGG
jgi:uncharacterized membrane protein YadS